MSTLTKEEIKKRINKINSWITKNPSNPMVGTAKKEMTEYTLLLRELDSLGLSSVLNTVNTAIYQQIGYML